MNCHGIRDGEKAGLWTGLWTNSLGSAIILLLMCINSYERKWRICCVSAYDDIIVLSSSDDTQDDDDVKESLIKVRSKVGRKVRSKMKGLKMLTRWLRRLVIVMCIQVVMIVIMEAL